VLSAAVLTPVAQGTMQRKPLSGLPGALDDAFAYRRCAFDRTPNRRCLGQRGQCRAGKRDCTYERKRETHLESSAVGPLSLNWPRHPKVPRFELQATVARTRDSAGWAEVVGFGALSAIFVLAIAGEAH